MTKYRNIISVIFRWALGALFIFSGAVKSVDPIGTSIFVDKYLATYSMEWLLPMSEVIAVGLSVMEFALGVLLILGVWRRVVVTITTIVLLIFSVLTLLSATVLPIGDCGCFGDALKLSPWATFLKNIILLPIAIALLKWSDEPQQIKTKYVVVLCLALLAPSLINLYALSHLPLVDFLPYKVGTNLREEIAKEQEAVQSVLRFRSILTDEIIEFDATDTSCWADEELEFVESALVVKDGRELNYSDFHLYSDNVDVTDEIIATPGRIVLLCVNNKSAIDASAKEVIAKIGSNYPKQALYIVSSDELAPQELSLEASSLYIDAMTLRSIIRADVGVVILKDGIVEFKANIKNL